MLEKQGVRGLGEEEPVQGRVWGGWEGKATDFDPSLRLGEEWRGEQGLRGKQAAVGLEFWPAALVLRIGLLDLTLELERK